MVVVDGGWLMVDGGGSHLQCGLPWSRITPVLRGYPETVTYRRPVTDQRTEDDT